MLLALALQGRERPGGAEAAELADRALELSRANRQLDPPAALKQARAATDELDAGVESTPTDSTTASTRSLRHAGTPRVMSRS